MSLQSYPELQKFLSTYLSPVDQEQDSQAVQSFVTSHSPENQSQVVAQAKQFLGSSSLVEDLGMESNRWFSEAEEAKEWLSGLIRMLESAETGESITVKDSNGTPLSDGDSVTVIKDLVVKGGSSDLKRGTLVKKIRLVGDPEVIECNVNGSTLVLKTCFLKKA